MSYNNGSDMWDWRGQVYSLEDHTSIASKSLLNEVEHNVDHISYMFDNETTPVKACGDVAYYVSNNETTGKESELYREHSSQVKRRRMLQFESEVLETPLCNEELLRSKETQQTLEAAISDMSQWVAGFTDGMPAASTECLDPSSEGWITDCFNEAEMHLCNEDFTSACEAPDVQIDVTELCKTAPEIEANLVENNLTTPRNIVFKGTKSFMRTPPKLASSVIYPFTFIKPCGVLGDTTLKDINQRIHNPPKPKPEEDDPSAAYPTSAFSGKPVVGKTKIHTEGGKGSITIMRTKG
ncbi:protein XRI1-like isoform X2 [Salvia miltiorrhiza]|uniref:protein XRI1-like isoform X2 n=1 Tax=Salvia miltiorrhiza TaxID=226208 RepID=UPI0025AD6C85|nr:protein XRI1-like isoform X2 [Salvia miltiorrhiza]XP_057783395.1 protein XRI1-like isoform X2 [Salvia miltiorrhiza]